MPDLAIPLFNAISNSAAVDGMPLYEPAGAGTSLPNVFTRKPVPADAKFPMILVSPDMGADDNGGLDFTIWDVIRDITVLAKNDAPPKYRKMEEIGYALITLFHGNRKSITVPGFRVVQVWAHGPMPIPSEDDMFIGRVVRLMIKLHEL